MTRKPNGCLLTADAGGCTFGWGDGMEAPPLACPMRQAPAVVVLQALDENGGKLGAEPCVHGCSREDRVEEEIPARDGSSGVRER